MSGRLEKAYASYGNATEASRNITSEFQPLIQSNDKYLKGWI